MLHSFFLNILSPMSFVKFTCSFNSEVPYESLSRVCQVRILCVSLFFYRETDSIETYAAHLVDLLESCLDNNLIPKNFKDEDTPHAKIASDLLSCIFLYYTKKSVMTVAIPTAVKMLSKSSKSLVRNTSSYLALAAIYNGRLLSQYALPILQSIRSGNYSLIRVLHQIYSENKEPFHAYLYSLLQVFDHCDNSEKLSLLQLCCSIATNKPDLMVPLLGSFCHPHKWRWSLRLSPAVVVLSWSVASFLKEIRLLADVYPDVVRPFIPELTKLAEPSLPALQNAISKIKDSCKYYTFFALNQNRS
ncbi:unnamed protein product [Soboliphyme baturini]|uniref:Adaptin_N domain-containing protein n=1 Tax=Soboliphyme baturini TaxID=241478 RepID=A0A183J5V9_9BILA|nr:unnamed protein product [Soboliphyme baturini]